MVFTVLVVYGIIILVKILHYYSISYVKGAADLQNWLINEELLENRRGEIMVTN